MCGSIKLNTKEGYIDLRDTKFLPPDCLIRIDGTKVHDVKYPLSPHVFIREEKIPYIWKDRFYQKLQLDASEFNEHGYRFKIPNGYHIVCFLHRSLRTNEPVISIVTKAAKPPVALVHDRQPLVEKAFG